MFAHRTAGFATRRNVVAFFARLLLLTTLVMVSLLQASHSRETGASQELLKSYFATAGVCTTSSIDSIVESDNVVIVNISVEDATAKALLGATSRLKDDWFSLHCPPEIHGVWRQQQPPEDVLIKGVLDATEHYSLSCRAYQDAQDARALTFRDKVRAALERMLSH